MPPSLVSEFDPLDPHGSRKRTNSHNLLATDAVCGSLAPHTQNKMEKKNPMVDAVILRRNHTGF